MEDDGSYEIDGGDYHYMFFIVVMTNSQTEFDRVSALQYLILDQCMRCSQIRICKYNLQTYHFYK